MVNLASHPYFRLAPLGSASDDHLLQVKSEHYLPIDGDGIPNGTPGPVEGTPLDLRRPRRLGDILRHPHAQIGNAGGLDHCYLLNDDPTSDEGLRFAATLTHPASLLRLDILTDQPGLQVYSANAFNGTQHDQLSRRLRQGDAIALEAQGFPDAPNQPHLGPVVLRQEETYQSHTQWRICSYERTVAPR